MSSSKSVRSSIELLLHILNENGTLKLKAEIFRLGKFNQDDAAEPLWHLLFELLYFCKFNSIEDVSVRAWMEMTKDEIVVYVRNELHRLGFLSADLASLPRDMSTGSRELLLAVGWLLCKQNIIQRFMTNCTAPLADDTANVHQSNLVARPEKTPPPVAKDLVERVRQLVWFNNKLQMNLRILHALLQDSAKLKHKINEATYGCSSDPDKKHLSMFEVYLLRHPDLLRKNIELLEKDNERLQHFISWIETEDVFWKWMESVLDEKQKEKQSGVTSGTADDVMTMSRDTWRRAQRSHDDLQDAIMKYEIIVENLERLWESKAVDVSEEELDSVLSAMDLELSIQRDHLQLSRHQHRPNQPPPSFVLDRGGEGSKANLATAHHKPSNMEPLRQIQEEISMLERTAEQLEQELDNRQLSLRHQLQPLSAHFSQAVCIPPMS